MISLKIQGGKELVRDLRAAPRRVRRAITKELRALGGEIVEVMQDVIEPHRYTGGLSKSIKATFPFVAHAFGESFLSAVEVRPTLTRGKKQWDAGELLEFGARPIPNVPWGPIAAWAEFRGAPPGPVWASIRKRGVRPHPFIDKAAEMIEPLVEDSLDNIAAELADTVLKE